MPNPKDSKEGCCILCGKYVQEEEYFHKCPVEEKHFPGCHKVHIECANKKIDEVTAHIKGIEHCSKMFEFETIQRRLISWLESLGDPDRESVLTALEQAKNREFVPDPTEEEC